MNPVSFQQNATVEVTRSPKSTPMSQCLLQGNYRVEHIRKGRRINEYCGHNGITIEGKNHLFNVMFNGTACTANWYIDLINLTGYAALAEADTYDALNQAGNGWDWFVTYTDGNNADSTITRPEWAPDTASGKAITNANAAIFDITANGTVKGIFVVGGANGVTKSDHTAANNTLWATALFTSGDVAVLIGDQLKVTYTVSAPAVT